MKRMLIAAIAVLASVMALANDPGAGCSQGGYDYYGRYVFVGTERCGPSVVGGQTVESMPDGSIWRRVAVGSSYGWEMVVVPTSNNFAQPTVAQAQAPTVSEVVTTIPDRCSVVPSGTPTPLPWLPEVIPYLVDFGVTP